MVRRRASALSLDAGRRRTGAGAGLRPAGARGELYQCADAGTAGHLAVGAGHGSCRNAGPRGFRGCRVSGQAGPRAAHHGGEYPAADAGDDAVAGSGDGGQLCRRSGHLQSLAGGAAADRADPGLSGRDAFQCADLCDEFPSHGRTARDGLSAHGRCQRGIGERGQDLRAERFSARPFRRPVPALLCRKPRHPAPAAAVDGAADGLWHPVLLWRLSVDHRGHADGRSVDRRPDLSVGQFPAAARAAGGRVVRLFRHGGAGAAAG